MSLDPSVSKAIEEKLGYSFKNGALLDQALSHISYGIEINKPGHNYQRMEFLGDACLNFILAKYLFHLYEEEREGVLARARAVLAQRKFLSNLARELNIHQFIQFGQYETQAADQNRDSILEDVLEAIIGAIMLDSNFETTETIILNWYGNIEEHLQSALATDNPKGRLQEHFQQQGTNPVEYKLVNEEGPDHEKTFLVQVLVNAEVLGEGKGKSKKEAEEAAAFEALSKVQSNS